MPRDLVSCSRRFCSGPSPTTIKWAKPFRKSGAAPRKARSQAFRGIKPPTKINSSFPPAAEFRESLTQREVSTPGSGMKNILSRYAPNSEYVWDEAAIIADAWRYVDRAKG